MTPEEQEVDGREYPKLRQFQIVTYCDHNLGHTLESLCYLSRAKLIAFKRTSRKTLLTWLLGSKSGSYDVILQIPSDETWNRLYEALFHQWGELKGVGEVKNCNGIVPMRPLDSGANDCMGRAFTDEVYAVNYVIPGPMAVIDEARK